MLNRLSLHRSWAGLIIPCLIWGARAHIPMSDWRTGIATNYGGAQDWRVSMLSSNHWTSMICSLMVSPPSSFTTPREFCGYCACLISHDCAASAGSIRAQLWHQHRKPLQYREHPSQLANACLEFMALSFLYESPLYFHGDCTLFNCFQRVFAKQWLSSAESA